MGGFNTNLFGVGLDVPGIVEQLLMVESAPIRAMESRQQQIKSRIDAYKNLRSRLLSLQNKIEALKQPSQFAARKATSSNEQILRATASGDAVAGSYQIHVQRLALVDSFASDAAFDAPNSAIGTGSFVLTVGSETETVTIDSSNNTLEGLRNAIDASGLAAQAGIIFDGNGYRLTLTSRQTGSDHAVSITGNSLTLQGGGSFNLSRTHDIGSVEELNAAFKINGLTLTSQGNQVEKAIPRVTLELSGTSEELVHLTVANDAEQVEGSIREFVDAYNEVYSFLNGQFQFNPATGRAGLLAGDSTLRRIQSDLSSVVSRSVPGLEGPLNNLYALGIEINRDGTLKVDESRLKENLTGTFDQIQRLFPAGLSSDDPRLSLISAGNVASGSFKLEITQLAQEASVTSPNAIGGTLGVNETLTVTMGNQSSVVELSDTMTRDEVIQALNQQFQADGPALSASDDGSNKIVLTSSEKGGNVSFTVVSDVDSGGTGFGTEGVTAGGGDIAGTFTDLATSVSYPATGVGGNVLKGTEGPVKDMHIKVSGEISLDEFGPFSPTIGYADRLFESLKRYTDTLEGPITYVVNGLEGQIRSLDRDIDNLRQRLELREALLTAEFARADQALRQLASLQATLNAQAF